LGGEGCNGQAVNYGAACAGSNGTPINTTRGLPTIYRVHPEKDPEEIYLSIDNAQASDTIHHVLSDEPMPAGPSSERPRSIHSRACAA